MAAEGTGPGARGAERGPRGAAARRMRSRNDDPLREFFASARLRQRLAGNARKSVASPLAIVGWTTGEGRGIRDEGRGIRDEGRGAWGVERGAWGVGR